MLDQSLLDDERAEWLYDKLNEGGDPDSMVDNWRSDPALTAACLLARRLAGPGTMTFATEFLEYLSEEASNYAESNVITWAEQLFADDSEWHHFGTAVWGGMLATAWAVADPEHLGIILYQLGDKVAVGAFSPV